ncbi:Re/Si-specific NAD(P)(+) transhydrogenase subunit alpha [Iodidimonas sp. SYSU 1G8]|uniref:Re/Si-specific NAD(P)(+) transhydrogenase subunit alpha n=1 Tax=Iodidimonas sp. SYSU 1G8 TaxID=3133967 RepID=UPI0031FF13E5
MKIAVPKERRPHERRVAVSPETVKKLKALGFDVVVETGAGEAAAMPDRLFAEAGATIAPDAASAYADADIVFKIQRPLRAGEGDLDEMSLIKRGAYLIASLSPYQDMEGVAAYASAGINAMAMELMPRISRAQSMDILSSQNNLAGYKAVIEAADHYNRAMPMMMTSAGTVAPAKVMVFGAGVSGLQAIATAKRLGAIVSATDVRPATKEQVESLGGKFLMVEDEESKAAETAAGYAKEMSDAYKAKQAKLIADTIAKQDIAITTALIPGRPAPKLIDEAMVQSMKPGSVIYDLAAETGGNCTLTVPGEVVVRHDVTIIGHFNVPSRVPVDASNLFAKNLLNFVSPHVKDGVLSFTWDDETVAGILLTRDGQIVHPQFSGQGA